MTIRNLLRMIVGVTAFAAGLLPAGAVVSEEKLKLTHTVYMGGLYVGDVKTDIVQTDDSYSIETKAQSSDTFKWLFSWVAEGQSRGLIDGNRFSPKAHIHQSAWNKKKRGAFIEYSPTGEVTFEIVGKPNANLKKYTPLDLKSIHSSYDPMTVLLATATRLQNGEECVGNYPVFDGRRRYDIVLSEVGEKLFAPSEYSVFQGSAKGCKIKVDKKGGFNRNSAYDVTEARDLVLWTAAPAEGTRVVPVRMQVETEFGAIEVHLANYSQGKVKLASKITP